MAPIKLGSALEGADEAVVQCGLSPLGTAKFEPVGRWYDVYVRRRKHNLSLSVCEDKPAEGIYNHICLATYQLANNVSADDTADAAVEAEEDLNTEMDAADWKVHGSVIRRWSLTVV